MEKYSPQFGYLNAACVAAAAVSAAAASAAVSAAATNHPAQGGWHHLLDDSDYNQLTQHGIKMSDHLTLHRVLHLSFPS